LQLPSGQVAFVGHEACELAAARALGMATVAFNCQDGSVADAHCLHFPELLELVQPGRLPHPRRLPARSQLH
jgi:FMN phosphatase YigB (HAD superfamily)